jgi:hypothetical protein
MKISPITTILAILPFAAADGVRGNERQLANADVDANIKCFSKDATVQVFGKGPMSMKDLQVGDQIFTGSEYQPVYGFAHHNPNVQAEFVKIQTDQDSSLEVTGGHFVYLQGMSSPVRADNIKVGDALQGAKVTSIETVQKQGVYAPLTSNGRVQVDGIMASNYVSLDNGEEHALFADRVAEFSHFGIAPFRLMCTRMTTCDSYNEDGVPKMLSTMQSFFEWATEQPLFVQFLAFAAHFMLAAMSWTMEMVPSAAPVLLVGIMAFLRGSNLRIRAEKVKSV